MKEKQEILTNYWQKIDAKNWDALAAFFTLDAKISWPNTKETFDVPRFIHINANYPGTWQVKIETIIDGKDVLITVVKVDDGPISFHAVSLFTFHGDKIAALTEYWGEDGAPPLWRQQLQ